MALTNLTRDKNQKTFPEQYCSSDLTSGIQNELLGLSALNIFLSVTAFLGNTLILVALHRESSLHSPSKLLYRSLAATDLCVGIIVEPLRVTYWMSVVNKQWNNCRYAIDSVSITNVILCLVSLLILTAISVDRLLALLLGLRYREVVTIKRTYLTIIAFWVASIAGATTYLWNPLITTRFSSIVLLLCLVITIFSYAKIFLSLKHNQIQVQNHVPQRQPNQAIQLNMARYRKALSSALWVQVTLVMCYLPYGIALALTSPKGSVTFSVYLARQFTATFVYLNSSLNPLLYCWKIREVRQAVKDTIRQFCCSSR